MVAIKVSADTTDASAQLSRLERAIAKAGQAGRALRDVKLDPKQFADAADELAKVQSRLDALMSSSRGKAWQRRAAASGFDPGDIFSWDFGRMYSNRSVGTIHSRLMQGDLTGKNAIPSIMQGEGAGSAASSIMSAAWAWGRKAAVVAGIGAPIMSAYRGRLSAMSETEPLWLRSGGTQTFEETLSSIRNLGSALRLTTDEAARLATGFQRVSGSTDPEMLKRVADAGRFGHGLGIGQDEGVRAFAGFERQGISTRESQRQFAGLIAESVAKGGIPDQVLSDFSKAIETFETTQAKVPSAELLERYASLRTSQYGNPATRGAGGQMAIDAMQGLLRGGDLIKDTFLLRSMGSEIGDNYTAFQYLRHGNVFQTAKEASGYGNSNETLLQKMLRQARLEAAATPGFGGSLKQRTAATLSAYSGMSPQQAEALIAAFENQDSSGGFREWLTANGVNASNLGDMATIADLAGLKTGKLGAQALKSKYLQNSTMSPADRERLESLSGEALLKELPSIISRAVPMNPAEEVRALPAAIARELEGKYGGKLVDITTEVKRLTLDGLTQLGQGFDIVERLVNELIGLAKASTPAIVGTYEILKKTFGDAVSTYENAVDATAGAMESAAGIPGKIGAALEGKPRSPKNAAEARAQQMAQYLRAKGITDPRELAAIIGNAWYESAGLNPEQEGPAGDFGLFQWTGSRKKQLLQYLEARHLGKGSMLGQMDFFLSEYLGSPERAGVRSAGSLKEMTSKFRELFERPPSGGASDADRYKRSLQALGLGVPTGLGRVSDTGTGNALLRQHLVPWKNPATSIGGLNSEFQERLARMIEAMPDELEKGVRIKSGYRTFQEQTEIFNRALKKYGSPTRARKWAALPGHSQHESGQAADLDFGGDAARKWVHAHAGEFGLGFRMKHEPWHIEPVPRIPDDADQVTKYNTLPATAQARIDGQIELNLRQQDHKGRTVLEQTHILKPEPKVQGTPNGRQAWKTDADPAQIW